MKISEIANIFAGYQFRDRISPELDGNVPVLQVKDLSVTGHVASFNASLLSRVAFEKDMSRYSVLPGDVLFLSRGHKVYAVTIVNPLPGLIVPNYFYVLRPKDSTVRPDYLAWAINSPHVQAQLRLVHVGSHMPIVALGDFAALRIMVPPLAVQASITALAALTQHEERLTRELLDCKQQLIDHVCIAAVMAGHDATQASKRKGTRP